nr:hypothetical protein TR92_11105 [Brucella anthropi]
MGDEFTLAERASVFLAYAWGALAQIPGWIPMATSLASLCISYAAFRRGAPPIWPRIWLQQKSAGDAGFTFILHVENDTDYPIVLDSIRSKDRSRKIAVVDMSAWLSLGDYGWSNLLEIGSEVAPRKSLDISIVLRYSDTKAMSVPVMLCSIKAIRRTIKCKTIPVANIAPIAKPKQI